MDGVLTWIMAVFAALWPGGGDDAVARYTGYVEADYAYIAPAHAGTVAEIAVSEGDTVTAGTVLFRLDAEKERAALQAARAKASAARARLGDRQAGSRPEELAIITDTLARARADFDLAKANFERSVRLRDRGVIAGAQFDKDRLALVSARARVREIEAQAIVARLPSRPGLIAAAKEDVRAAEAEVESARILLDETTVFASVKGRVDRVYFTAGEQAGPAAPVVSVLTEGALKVRFFLPQSERVNIALGNIVIVDCDGCPSPVKAKIVRLASQAQFTPPVIYSLDERDRLVFMVEARPLGPAAGLLPGQPVDVRRAP